MANVNPLADSARRCAPRLMGSCFSSVFLRNTARREKTLLTTASGQAARQRHHFGGGAQFATLRAAGRYLIQPAAAKAQSHHYIELRTRHV